MRLRDLGGLTYGSGKEYCINCWLEWFGGRHNHLLHSNANGFGPPSQRTGTARIAASPISSGTRDARNVIVSTAEGGVELAAERSADDTKDTTLYL